MCFGLPKDSWLSLLQPGGGILPVLFRLADGTWIAITQPD